MLDKVRNTIMVSEYKPNVNDATRESVENRES